MKEFDGPEAAGSAYSNWEESFRAETQRHNARIKQINRQEKFTFWLAILIYPVTFLITLFIVWLRSL